MMQILERIDRLSRVYISALNPLRSLELGPLEAFFIFLITSIPYSILLSVSLSGKVTEFSLLVPVAFFGFWLLSALWLWMVNSFKRIQKVFFCSSSLLAPHLPMLLLLAPYFHLYGFGIYGAKALYFWTVVLMFVVWSTLRLRTICSTLEMGKTKSILAAVFPLALVLAGIHFGLLYISNGNFSLLDFFKLI